MNNGSLKKRARGYVRCDSEALAQSYKCHLVYLHMEQATIEGNTAMLKKLTPNLMVEDVSHTIDFYRNILGFELLTTVPDQVPFDFAIMRRDSVELMFQSRQSLSENVPALAGTAIGASQTFYIEVTGIIDADVTQ